MKSFVGICQFTVLVSALCSLPCLVLADPCQPMDDGTISIEGENIVKFETKDSNPVKALDDGIVTQIVTHELPSGCDMGSALIVEHPKGKVTYCNLVTVLPKVVHLASVKKGQPIAILKAKDSDGNATLTLNLADSRYTQTEFALEKMEACPKYSNCYGRNCGSDDAGGSCGTCLNNAVCVDGLCTCLSTMTEADYECGDDGCGHYYKSCEMRGMVPYTCVEESDHYKCQQVSSGDSICVPQCIGIGTGTRKCGADGCGGTCGTCPNGMTCQQYQCVCEDRCGSRQCGLNACGQSCGTCPEGTTCDEADGLCKCYVSDVSEQSGKERFQVMDCRGKQCEELDSICGAKCPCTQTDSDYDGQCLENTCGHRDAMGGFCGRCIEPYSCHIRRGCILPDTGCIPNCEDRVCDGDGCGGVCGECAPGYHCFTGVCVLGGTAQTTLFTSSGCQFVSQPLKPKVLGFGMMILGVAGLILTRRRRV